MVTMKKLWCESLCLSAESDTPRQTEVDRSLFSSWTGDNWTGTLGANWKYSKWDTLRLKGHWFKSPDCLRGVFRNSNYCQRSSCSAALWCSDDFPQLSKVRTTHRGGSWCYWAHAQAQHCAFHLSVSAIVSADRLFSVTLCAQLGETTRCEYFLISSSWNIHWW